MLLHGRGRVQDQHLWLQGLSLGCSRNPPTWAPRKGRAGCCPWGQSLLVPPMSKDSLSQQLTSQSASPFPCSSSPWASPERPGDCRCNLGLRLEHIQTTRGTGCAPPPRAAERPMLGPHPTGLHPSLVDTGPCSGTGFLHSQLCTLFF